MEPAPTAQFGPKVTGKDLPPASQITPKSPGWATHQSRVPRPATPRIALPRRDLSAPLADAGERARNGKRRREGAIPWIDVGLSAPKEATDRRVRLAALACQADHIRVCEGDRHPGGANRHRVVETLAESGRQSDRRSKTPSWARMGR